MSGINNQIQQSIAPALSTINNGTAASVGDAQQGYANASATNQATQTGVNNTLNPFSSMGTDAYSSYLNALGIPTQTSAATPGTYAQYNVGPLTGTGTYSNVQDATAAGVKNSATAVKIQQQLNSGQITLDQANALLTQAGISPGAFTQSAAATPAQAAQYSTPTGTPYSTAINNALGVNGATGTQSAISAFQAAPGYQSGYNQGLVGVNQQAASMGLLGSGAQLQALDVYGQNYANQGFNSYLSNLQNQNTSYLGNLASAAGIGGTAAGQQAADITSSGNANQSAATTAGGQAASAQTQGTLASAQAQLGNRYIPGLSTAVLGMGSTSL